MDNDTLIVDAVVDIPSKTDYKFNDIMGNQATQPLPVEVVYDNTPVFNQALNNDPDTNYACTRYGTTHGINEMNHLEGSGIMVDPVQEWAIALEKYGAIINRGDSLRSALQQAKDRDYISGYAVTDTVYQMQYALAIEQMLYTWSKKIDWRATRRNDSIVVPGSSGGHARIFIGYDTRWFIGRNSYDEDRYTYTTTSGRVVKGGFCVPYEHIDVLFTCYALFDKVNVDKIKAEKIRRDRADIQAMVDLGISNGQNLEDNITREQALIMLGRLYRNLGS